MNTLRRLIWPARHVLALSTLAALVSGAAGVGLIATIHAAIGRAASGGFRVEHSGSLGAAFFGLCLLAAVPRALAQVATIRLAHAATADLASTTCRKLLDLPLARFESTDHARVLAVLTEDISLVASTLATLPLAMSNASLILVCIAYVGWKVPAIVVSALAFGLLAGPVYHALTHLGARHLRDARSRQDALVEHYRTMIGGFRELKQHRSRRESFHRDALAAEAGAVRDRMIRGLTWFSMSGAWGQLALFGFVGYVVFALPRFVEVSAETLAGVVLVLLYLMVPIDVLLSVGANWVRAGASLTRIDALMPDLDLAGPAGLARTALPAPGELPGPIRLEGVSYTYADPCGIGPGRDWREVGPIDLEVQPGEILFVVGGNGSGKTTLIKLLAGLYRPDRGSVSVDGRAVVDEPDREAYRQMFSVVFADGHLFREVRGADPVGLSGRAAAWLDRLGLSDLVDFDGERFSTVDLSQGQKRRLALAAACLDARPVAVLDEWAANQDPAFRRVFYRELLPELRAMGKTLVVVTHDDDYFAVADRVVRLREGRVVEESPAEPSMA